MIWLSNFNYAIVDLYIANLNNISRKLLMPQKHLLMPRALITQNTKMA